MADIVRLEGGVVAIGCETCGHLACVCRIKAEHEKGCPYRLAATCAVPVECDHGYDVCPICDPCICQRTL